MPNTQIDTQYSIIILHPLKIFNLFQFILKFENLFCCFMRPFCIQSYEENSQFLMNERLLNWKLFFFFAPEERLYINTDFGAQWKEHSICKQQCSFSNTQMITSTVLFNVVFFYFFFNTEFAQSLLCLFIAAEEIHFILDFTSIYCILNDVTKHLLTHSVNFVFLKIGNSLRKKWHGYFQFHPPAKR